MTILEDQTHAGPGRHALPALTGASDRGNCCNLPARRAIQHGDMNPGDQPRICWDCGFQSVDPQANCSRCGSLMLTPRSIRRRGWALIGVGCFLLAMMTATIAAVAYVIAQSGEPGATSRFDGGPAAAAFTFGVLGLVWIIGLASLENGIWLLRYRKRNRLLVNATLGICSVLWFVGLLIQFFD